MSGSNCWFLTCIQFSQEVGKVIWYSPFLSEFSTVCCDPLSVISETEVDVFLEFPCFLCDPVNVGNLVSGSSAFSKPSLYTWNFSVHVLLKPSLKDLEHNLASM